MAKRQAQHLALVPQAKGDQFAGRSLPQTHDSIFTTGRESRAVGACDQYPGATDVSGKNRDGLARLGIVNRKYNSFWPAPDHGHSRPVVAAGHQVGPRPRRLMKRRPNATTGISQRPVVAIT